MRPRRSQTFAALFTATGLVLAAGCDSTAASDTVSNPAARGTTAVVAQAPPERGRGASTGRDGGHPGTHAANGDLGPALKSGPAPAPLKSEAAAPVAGAYLNRVDDEKNPSAAAQGKVVPFFHAGCSPPASRPNATSAPVPSGLTVVKVDCDNSNELRQKYG